MPPAISVMKFSTTRSTLSLSFPDVIAVTSAPATFLRTSPIFSFVKTALSTPATAFVLPAEMRSMGGAKGFVVAVAPVAVDVVVFGFFFATVLIASSVKT